MGKASNEILQVIYNPYASNIDNFQREIMIPLENGVSNFKHIDPIKTASARLEDNIHHIAPKIKDGATVMLAGGDGMYFQGLNAVMESDRDIKCMGVWGLGNVNDAAFALNGMRRATDPRIVNLADDESHVHDYYPLTLYADSRHTCFAMSYVSLGITGWFAGEINKDNVRKKLREQRSNRFTSTLHVARMYLGGGFESSALPRRSHGSPSGRERTETSSSDTVYMNGPRMAGFVHSGVDYGFLPYSMRTDIDIHNHPFVAAPLVGRMLLSNIMPIEGVEEQVHWLEFAREAGVTPVQCDGDQLLLKGVRRISIAKRDKLPVLRPRKSPIRENGRFRSIVAKQ